jgi:formylmethanofuran dehydrogenase subunit B
MSQSSINGQAAPLDAVIAEAAKLIGASRLTVVAGLGADVAGARAAIALCERIRGVVDQMHSAALLRDLDVMREYGVMLTTPLEAAIRGDVVLLVGAGLWEAGLGEAWPDLRSRVLKPLAAEGAARRVIWLGPSNEERAEIESVDVGNLGLPQTLAALRARVNRRPVALAADRLAQIDAVAAALRSATFGVAVWSATHLDALSIEMLSGLVKDLNANTRFTSLPLTPPDNAAGVQQACGWLTGLPPRTGFARGYAEHDPWIFDAERLVKSGEADCVVWISCYGTEMPRWSRQIAVIALTGSGAKFAQPPAAWIEVGRPGVDHDGVDYHARMATFALRAAARPTETPSVSEVIGRLSAALGGAPPC